MVLRAFYFIRALTKTYYYISRSQRHFLAAIENKLSGVPIEHPNHPESPLGGTDTDKQDISAQLACICLNLGHLAAKL